MATVPRSERASARQAAYKKGLALPPPSRGAAPGYPVQDADHWDKARRAVGRVKDPQRRAQLAKLLRKTAPRFGKQNTLKQSWAAKGASMAGDSYGISLAVRAKDEQGLMLTCPECDYSGPAHRFGSGGASLDRQPGMLRTPAPGTGQVRSGAAVTVRGGKAAHALANTRGAVELATGTRRHPVSSPLDVLVTRGDKGAVIRHRSGGGEIAQIRRNDDGTWTAVVAGKDLQPHAHQRAALLEAVGTWNKGLPGARPVAPALQPDPVQTPLMAEYGIPAMRSAAFATPMTSASAGPRMTTAGGGDSDDDEGLSLRGKAIRDKLIAKGLPRARAVALAKRSQEMTPGRPGRTAA